MLTARDYQNNEYPILAKKIVTSELNGNEDLELRIPQQKNNNLDLLAIDKLWEFDYNNITYKIVYVKQQTRGNGFYLNVRATPLFYWDFDKSIIHENHDGSHTANEAFRRVFEGTGYNYVLVDFSPSLEWEGFGKGATRLEMFKRLIDRYNYEFTINGSTVTMRHLIGNDTNFMYKHKLNASNVSRSTDASAMFTHIKGFGNYDEGEEDYYKNAKLKREFTSPLADIVGKWEGKPIVDGRVKQADTLDEMMKEAVESSLDITVEGTLHDIRKMGYEVAVPTKGDRVWLLDDRIDLEQEIRVYSVKTTYDERDNIIDCEVTFGSQSIRERHKANINTLSKNFADLLTGQLKLPIISLEKIGMDMINAIHAASSEIIFGDFGMQAISKTNPNHVFGLNSEGWYISQDGGKTPRTIATAEGIYADALFAGTLWLTNDMNIESDDGYLNVTGSRFTMKNTEGTESTVIEPGKAFFSGNVTILRNDGAPFIQDGHALFEIPIITKPNMDDGVEFGRRNYITANEHFSLFEAGYTSHSGRWANFGLIPGLSSDSRSTSAHIEVTIEVANSPGGVNIPPVTHRQLVYRDSSNEGFVLNLRLPRVTYGALSFLLKFKLVSAYSGNKAIIRSTRCWISG
ncbi:MAG TPA: phage tail protein [Staphylococcus saprophyticus]|nr:phage tail protein [Staphylococcus saprophyticus]